MVCGECSVTVEYCAHLALSTWAVWLREVVYFFQLCSLFGELDRVVSDVFYRKVSGKIDDCYSHKTLNMALGQALC